jgi:hypothetical protein
MYEALYFFTYLNVYHDLLSLCTSIDRMLGICPKPHMYTLFNECIREEKIPQ